VRVFISWSGETSKKLAQALNEWLPSVVQAVKPYFSPEGIAKGTRWGNEISKELEACAVGLLCMTRDNLEAPWIMFEAGALSKSLTSARVVPILFGIEPSDIEGPCEQFEAAKFSREEMQRTLAMINEMLGTETLTPSVFNTAFDKWWPDLEVKVTNVLNADNPQKVEIRKDREILEEILERVRALEKARTGAAAFLASSSFASQIGAALAGITPTTAAEAIAAFPSAAPANSVQDAAVRISPFQVNANPSPFQTGKA